MESTDPQVESSSAENVGWVKRSTDPPICCTTVSSAANDDGSALRLTNPTPSFMLRGGVLGAIVVGLFAAIAIATAFSAAMYRERQAWAALTTPEARRLVVVAIELTFAAALLGFFAGREGARRTSVNAAFLWGGVLCGLATVICLPVLYFTYFKYIRMYTSGIVAISSIFFAILAASGALVSGLAAIMVRDRRESGRNRVIPQFTLQEIFIVFTIASVIISALASAAVLRL
jgi:hypothetical protein